MIKMAWTRLACTMV